MAEKEGGFAVGNKECGDHGVRWRLAYTLKSSHRLIESGNCVREHAYRLQKKHGVELATPLTHVFPKGSIGK
jgi:hypothetical protein